MKTISESPYFSNNVEAIFILSFNIKFVDLFIDITIEILEKNNNFQKNYPHIDISTRKTKTISEI